MNRIVVALGGNALLRRSEAPTALNQLANITRAAAQLAPLASSDRQLVITHGNGPQVGMLALQTAASEGGPGSWPLDVLDAESEGMIGYQIELGLRNQLRAIGNRKSTATVLTMVEVSLSDPAFSKPTKFVGKGYSNSEASELSSSRSWTFKKDGDKLRRVVASPKPLKIVELEPITWLLERGAVVIAAGGGGIPTSRDSNGVLKGVEAVVDKDLASCLLAKELGADALVMLTDVDCVYLDYGKPDQRQIARVTPEELEKRVAQFPEGSMRPKVEAAIDFSRTGKRAFIGGLSDLEGLLAGQKGTEVSMERKGLEFR
jgi:carbamate kinase